MASDKLTGYLVVAGASAGGVPVLLEIARTLPADFPAPLCVVQHVGAHPSILPELLAAKGPLAAIHARDGDLLTPGVIHVAPPDHHLLVEGSRLRLTRAAKEHYTRPAIDPLFRSAALAWGPRTIGVVMTGCLDDGRAGLAAIKGRGGTAIVQDPASAEEPEMPVNALAAVEVDFVVSAGEIAALLARLVRRPEPAEAGGQPGSRHNALLTGEGELP